jgi:hypothetical protein
LPIRPNHEDDTSNQGSGNTRAANLPIVVSDCEDEDDDNESHSLSVYFLTLTKMRMKKMLQKLNMRAMRMKKMKKNVLKNIFEEKLYTNSD